MPFNDVLSQTRAAEHLQQAMRADRVAHAYVFRGPDGVGKAKMALTFAAALLCSEVPADSCGHCRDCMRVAGGNHPDVDLIEHPTGKRYINIEQIRRLSDAAHRTNVESNWHVFIIRDAERMQMEAQNALLKTLEEPLPGRVLILVASRPDRLLPTILSRCHHLRFQPLEHAHMMQVLEGAETGLERTEIERVVACAGGSAGRAMLLLRTDALALCDDLLPRVEALRTTQAFALAEEIQEAASGKDEKLEGRREHVRLILDLLTAYYRDVVLMSEQEEPEGLCFPDRANSIRELARRPGAGAAERAIDLLWRARTRIEQNANIRLTLEDALLSIAEVQA